jgi:putative oxidoreductase
MGAWFVADKQQLCFSERIERSLRNVLPVLQVSPDCSINPMNKLLFSLFQTSASFGPLVLRVFLAIVMFPHGAQKLLGWFGGIGFSASMASFTHKMGIPLVFAILAVLAEFLGPIALFFGFLTRIAALAIGFDMLVAAILVHVHFGFFMNWGGKQKGEGVEFDLLLWAIALALLLEGAGAFSVDRMILARFKKMKWKN